MKHIKLFEQFINEALNPSKLKEKFTKETGISTWDRVKSENEKGVWTVTSIFTPKEMGGTGEGLHIQISQGRTVAHFMVMDDDGNLTSGARRLTKKMNESDTESNEVEDLA